MHSHRRPQRNDIPSFPAPLHSQHLPRTKVTNSRNTGTRRNSLWGSALLRRFAGAVNRLACCLAYRRLSHGLPNSGNIMRPLSSQHKDPLFRNVSTPFPNSPPSSPSPLSFQARNPLRLPMHGAYQPSPGLLTSHTSYTPGPLHATPAQLLQPLTNARCIG